ncbi:MAG TPA: hypothetical protein VL947_08885 [Cytophagales bacterium]|nr:hypothetical protein [Cytophagales bacterium]
MGSQQTPAFGFKFWVGYLKVASLFFALMGAMWALLGSFDPIGVYDHAFAQAFWGTDQLPADAQKAFSFILGPFGATTAAYFVMQYYIAVHAYAQRQRWGYDAIVVPFVGWFVLDTTMSLIHKAYFNILIANIPCLLVMLPIFFTRRYFKEK